MRIATGGSEDEIRVSGDSVPMYTHGNMRNAFVGIHMFSELVS